jgi:D-xylulose reductase
MPPEPVQFDLVRAQNREARIETAFRDANVYEKAVTLIASDISTFDL